MSELALQLIAKEKIERTGKLDLGNCGLTDFPEELFELDWLEELSFCNKNIFFTDLKLTPENRIQLSQTENNCLPNGFSHLSKLKKLRLGENWMLQRSNIKDVSVLSDIKSLEFLSIQDNQINDIGFLKKLTSLTSLNLRGNQISDISILEKLTNLTDLNLSYNNINEILTLEKLTNLNSLDLSINYINDISILERLTNLNSLDLSSTQINDISPLKRLTYLTSLNLNDNEISDISILEKLINLTSLDLCENQIKDTSVLEKLINLSSLKLSDNQIQDVSFLGKLTNLESIDLRNNQINNIKALIPLLQKGLPVDLDNYGYEGISLYNNPINNPPMSIVEQGTEAILDWFDQIDESGAEPFYESKLMILGQGEVGKTTFANLLLNPDYEVKPGNLDSTLGIVIHKGKEFSNTHKDLSPVKTHLWDFGGQDIQKMLHQFFITENCLYVLICNKRTENANFDYWFQIINLLGPKSSVIVLENPIKTNGNNEDFPKNKYQRLYPDLNIESIEVNLIETRGKDEALWIKLNQMISEKLSEMELVNRMVPKKWGMVRKELENLRKKKHISLESYYELCAKPEIGFNTRQADWCLSYFRSLGDLVYFDDRDLCSHIFLDQNWLTTGLYYILSDEQIKKDGGRFTQQQAYAKWEGKEYNKTEKAMLIKLLLKNKFDICYELPDEKEVFITPLLLPSDAPKEKWEHQPNLQFRYSYGFIPHGLFSRLIVQLHEKIESEQHWKTGVRLIDTIEGGKVYAEVQQYNDPTENKPVIEIQISGEKNGCKQMLAYIREAVEKLHKDFNNIKVEQMVACNCETCMELIKKGSNPWFYEYDMLWDKAMNQNYFVDCKESKWKQVNIGQVLNDVVIENAANDNIDRIFFNRLIEKGMSFNQITNIAHGGNATSASTSSSTSSSVATATSTVTITINNILGEVKNLKEDFEDEKKLIIKGGINEDDYEIALKDIGKAEKALSEIEKALKQNQALPEASKSRLKRFIDDLSDETSTLHKGLKLLRKGRDYGVNLAKLYNKIAANTGMPPVPALALEVIKRL